MRALPSILLTMLCLTVLLSGQLVASQQDQVAVRGQRIYQAECASCHGDRGQGTPKNYRDRLIGDLSIEALAEVISETMPEDDPDACVAKDAHAVANYIHQAFYSPEAQLRSERPRAELTHLTVNQYLKAVADLTGSYGKPMWIPPHGEKHSGLHALYLAASNRDRKKQLSETRAPNIDFGDSVPHFRADGKYEGIPEDKDRKNKMGLGYSAYWNGGVVAPDTGTYQIVVESRNGFRLWINDLNNPLIDRWVRSDQQLTHRASLPLLGGRLYSLKLEMFAFEEDQATMRLLWKPPHGSEVPIPPEALFNVKTAEVAVISTPFPPDDESRGYRRGTDVSAEWDAATTSAALEAATWVSERIWQLARKKEHTADTAEAFCIGFVERAFATPLNEEEKKFFVEQHFQEERSVKDSVKRVVILTLKSPRFLYPTTQPRKANRETAQRLALFFWDSLPDRGLTVAARKKQLEDPATLQKQIDRMLEDPRSKQKLREFFHHWLQFEESADTSKDQERFPGFDQAIANDLRLSLDRQIDEVIWSEGSDFRQLFLSKQLYANHRIAKFYELDATHIPESEPSFVRVDSPEHYSGILTHPFLMSRLAYHRDSSPIHRGVFVTRQLLGRSLKQPPDAVAPLTESFDPKMTTRQRVEYQTRDSSCMVCHRVINPLGFSLENFDAVGRFRKIDREQPVDSSTEYNTRTGKDVALNSPRDLALLVAHSEQAQKNFISRLFQYYVHQSVQAYGPEQLDILHQQFVDSDTNVRKLVKSMARVVIAGPKPSE